VTKVHTVYRVIKSRLGGSYIMPVKVYDDPKNAETASKQSAATFGELAEGSIIVNTPQGPKRVMTVKQLLVELGIDVITHSVLSQDVHGAIVLAPTGVAIQ